MTLLIERREGSRGTIQFPLSPQVTGGKLSLSFRLFILTIQAVFPAFCLLLGLWVVAAKPRDPNAWYVLGIFGFIQCFFANASYWNGPILPFMSVYSDLAFIVFFLSMLLFGIYFPEPVALDSRYPWAKWILIAPSLAFAALDVIIDLGRNVDFQISSWIPSWLQTLGHRTESAIAVICISLFFITLFPKYFTACLPGVSETLQRRVLSCSGLGRRLSLASVSISHYFLKPLRFYLTRSRTAVSVG
jgi:hypothetical protein